MTPWVPCPVLADFHMVLLRLLMASPMSHVSLGLLQTDLDPRMMKLKFRVSRFAGYNHKEVEQTHARDAPTKAITGHDRLFQCWVQIEDWEQLQFPML